MVLMSLLACQREIVCREPDVTVFPVEGEPAGLCDVTFSACENGDFVSALCDNDTFEGDYACSWTVIAGIRARGGTFHHPDFCRLDVDEMVEVLDANLPYALTIE